MRRSVYIVPVIILFMLQPCMVSGGGTRVDTLSEPQDLTAVPGNGIVRLSWLKPSIGSATVLGYNLYRGGSASSLVLFMGVPGSTNYNDLVENGILYYYAVTAYSAIGESQISNIVSCVGDGTAPEVEIQSPADMSYLNGGFVTASWTGSDQGSGMMKYVIAMDDGTPLDVGLSKDHTYNDLDDGEHSLSISATDKALNIGMDKVGFILDNIPPTLMIAHPFEDENIDGPDISIRWESADGLSGIDGAWITLDDTVYSVKDTNEFMISSVLEGHYTLYLEIRDRSGNARGSMVNFTVDLTAPVLSIPQYPRYVAIDRADIRIQVEDEMDQDPLLHFELNGELVKVSNVQDRFTIVGLIEGLNNVSITASDRAGNTVSSSIFVLYDKTPPEIFINLLDWTTLTVRNVTMTYEIREYGSGIEKVTLSIDGFFPKNIERSGSREIRFDTDGGHDILIRASDRVNNTSERRLAFFVDSIPPEIIEYSPKGYVGDMDAIVVVRFSEPMDKDRTHLYSTILSGSERWEDDSIILSPDTLPMAETILIIVTGYDLAGNALRESSFEFETTSEGTVTGTVVDPNGDPIFDASVTLDNGRAVRTLTDGTFMLADQGGSDRYIIVSKSGYEDLRLDLPIVPGREYKAGMIQLERSHDEGGSSLERIGRVLGIALVILISISLIVFLAVQSRRPRYDD